MTSSSDPWTASGGETGLRAQRWAPAELHHEPPQTEGHADSASHSESPVEDPIEKARTEAFELGVAEGLDRAAAELDPVVEALNAAINDIQDARPAWFDAVEKNVMTLAIAVARQIVGHELTTDPDHVRQLVARALNRFPIEVPVTVRLHPSDLARISAATVGNPSSDPAMGRDARWRADAHITEGSCVVEGPERMVDGRVDKALLRIYQALVTDDAHASENP